MSEQTTRKKRNKYDVDEVLDSPFNIGHLARSAKYIKKHTKSLILAFVCSALAAAASLTFPYLLKIVIDTMIPDENVEGMFVYLLRYSVRHVLK